MNKHNSLLVMIIGLALAGCAATKVARLSPPQAYLQLPPQVAVPNNDATQLQLINYVFKLHDSDTACRQQIRHIKQWLHKQDKQ